jgi:protein gp37
MTKIASKLTWFIFTKRPENIPRFLPSDWGRKYANVQLGVSVEDQAALVRRAPLLAAVQATRFYSIDPLIGSVDLREHLDGISWVVVGPEEGPSSRPMDPQWTAEIRARCRERGVRVFDRSSSLHEMPTTV